MPPLPPPEQHACHSTYQPHPLLPSNMQKMAHQVKHSTWKRFLSTRHCILFKQCHKHPSQVDNRCKIITFNLKPLSSFYTTQRKQKIVNLTTLLSLVAPKVVITTTYGATSDDKIVKVTNFCFQSDTFTTLTTYLILKRCPVLIIVTEIRFGWAIAVFVYLFYEKTIKVSSFPI